jgi:hypothetical protein
MPINYSSDKECSLPKVIYLFGHRQGHGKDTCCDIMEDLLKDKMVYYKRTMFAKTLKQHCCDRYGLDFSRMDDQDYKLSIVPHASQKITYIDEASGSEVPHWVFMDPGKLKVTQKVEPRTVRDILIEEGRFARSIWGDTWAWHVYNEIYSSGCEIGIVSDFRYPNEADPVEKLYNLFLEKNNKKYQSCIPSKPKIIKIQVYRPDGVFKNDGADAELPDDFDFYDYNIMNEPTPDWRNNLKRQIRDILDKTYFNT